MFGKHSKAWYIREAKAFALLAFYATAMIGAVALTLFLFALLGE